MKTRINVIIASAALAVLAVFGAHPSAAEAALATAPSAVRGTPVTRIRALGNIHLRTGPSLNHRVVGKLYYGDVARVTGASDHYGWWRVVCPWGGTCWISANPNYTKPIAWR
jgi:uncharacterized protein YgiM (DUF1202 family)